MEESNNAKLLRIVLLSGSSNPAFLLIGCSLINVRNCRGEAFISKERCLCPPWCGLASSIIYLYGHWQWRREGDIWWSRKRGGKVNELYQCFKFHTRCLHFSATRTKWLCKMGTAVDYQVLETFSLVWAWPDQVLTLVPTCPCTLCNFAEHNFINVRSKTYNLH